jgi:RND family efflux transporter MFP subunit
MRSENKEEGPTGAEMAQASGRPAHSPSGKRSGRPWLALGLFLVVVAGVVAAGIIPRLKARASLKAETQQLAVPVVTVVHPRRSAPAEEIVLPANIQAWIDAPIYARTNGYLKRWYADIGTRVKAGELLAEIETPEVDQQLGQARADLATAQATSRLAGITATRFQELLKTDSVSKQDADNASGDLEAKRAIVQSAEANVRRLQDLQSFQRIYAPFDGIITARNIDVGALIDAGSSGGPARELFHLASIRKLRVYVNVPQTYSQAARPGLSADLVLREFPGRRFSGTLASNANAIDQSTRTLLAQFEVQNPNGELLPGAYAELHLKIPSQNPSFLLPVNTLLFRSEGLRIVAVGPDSKAVLMPIILGRDFGNDVEVVSGLNGDERIVVDPPDSVVPGESLRVAETGGAQAKP